MKKLLPLALLVAVPLSASITYDVETKTKTNRRNVEITAHVTADDAGHTRVEITKSNNDRFRTGTILLGDGTDSVKVLDPAQKTWYAIDASEAPMEMERGNAPRVRVQPGIGIGGGRGRGGFGGRGGMGGGFGGRGGRGGMGGGYGRGQRPSFGEPEITNEDRGFETIDGRIVHYRRIEIVRKSDDDAFESRQTIDIWSDEKLPTNAQSFFHHTFVRDDRLEDALASVTGLPIRMKRKQTMSGRESVEASQELTVKAIADAKVETTAFAVPQDFSEVDPPERTTRRAGGFGRRHETLR
ncbi:MAG TPA: hypothetical protein VMU84_13330 [Thermoanaerobaculia bacterium]|nr:hypothetical protein [Thermoanaerobaculia bacterium]